MSHILSVGDGMDLTIPEDLSIPAFLKRKKNVTNQTGIGNPAEAGIAAPENRACIAAAPQPTDAVEGSGTVSRPPQPGSAAYDALLKKIRRRTRKHQEPTGLSKRK